MGRRGVIAAQRSPCIPEFAMRKLLTLLAVVGLTAAACASDDPVETQRGDDGIIDDDIVIDIGGESIRLASSLSGFDSCDTLLDHLRTEGALSLIHI